MDLPSVVAGLDVHEARWGIGRDLSELESSGWVGRIVLALIFGLPVASLTLLFYRRWLAVVPLMASLACLSGWFLYYATDWWANPGLGGFAMVFVVHLAAWLFVPLAAFWPSIRSLLVLPSPPGEQTPR